MFNKTLILLSFLVSLAGQKLAWAEEECRLDWESEKGKVESSDSQILHWQPARQGRSLSGSVDNGLETATLEFQWRSDLDFSRLANPAQSNQQVNIQLVRHPGSAATATEWSYQQAVRSAGKNDWQEVRELEAGREWPLRANPQEKILGFRLICRGEK
jgi:hypothetical protein